MKREDAKKKKKNKTVGMFTSQATGVIGTVVSNSLFNPKVKLRCGYLILTQIFSSRSFLDIKIPRKVELCYYSSRESFLKFC